MGVVSEDVKEAIVNEYRDILELLTENVTLIRRPAPEGCICQWEFVVKAKSHYLDKERDMNPKETAETVFWVDVKEGYPKVKPHVYYDPNRRLASVNVYRNGSQCIDEWIFDDRHAGNNSSLLTTVEKTIKDIIHDPSVSRFDSMANSDIAAWQKKHIEDHSFPTCRLSHVFRMGSEKKRGEFVEIPELPVSYAEWEEPPALPVC